MVIETSDQAASTALEELIQQRRSIRSFENRPVPRHVVEELLRDVIWAPSPHNSQPWRFTVLFREDDRERLADGMAERLWDVLRADALPDEEIQRQAERSRQRIICAPVALLCSLEHDGLVAYPDARRNELEWQMAVQSVGAALQTLFLLAHARSIGTCWMAAPMYCPDVVRDALDLPATFSPQALVLMGFAAKPGKLRPRRPFHEVVDLR